MRRFRFLGVTTTPLETMFETVPNVRSPDPAFRQLTTTSSRPTRPLPLVGKPEELQIRPRTGKLTRDVNCHGFYRCILPTVKVVFFPSHSRRSPVIAAAASRKQIIKTEIQNDMGGLKRDRPRDPFYFCMTRLLQTFHGIL